MCTAVTYKTNDHYFGRTLDFECSFDEKVVITPRNFPFHFRKVLPMDKHYAIIGIGTVENGFPLYFDASNEKGLCMAGLNFPGNADYKQEMDDKDNVAPFEFIPWMLGQCANVSEAKRLLERVNLENISFSERLPLSPLHWMIADRDRSIVVESVKAGLKIYDNPVGVLTNNPPFDVQLFNLNNYMHLSVDPPKNTFSEHIQLDKYSRGMGAFGLPGDLSSASRFVRAAFTKMNSVSGNSESESISQFFHILGAVEQLRGCVRLAQDVYEKTIYTSCCNTDKGIYYYTTYENHQISSVDMNKENLDESNVITYPLIKNQQLHRQN